MTPQSNGWEHIGPHPIRFEAPDIVFCRPIGRLSAADVRGVLDFNTTIAKRLGRGTFYLGDSSRITGYSIASSLQLFQATPAESLRGTAIFGESFHQRVQNSAVLRGIRLLAHPLSRLPIETFPSEAEARAWIDEQRRKG
ncbi:hypothetical protein [Polyangium sp. 6x1]|uniref:hypothetical protein n=1 Tax=Polyangium sp. 6x1 TaxID=3042689 RepID=UPI002482CAED|nr:hypothetical protein [Polyangium sp. 6x1]MDI1444397.1 hypothetical protein [Polyangium sp. 6x1]